MRSWHESGGGPGGREGDRFSVDWMKRYEELGHTDASDASRATYEPGFFARREALIRHVMAGLRRSAASPGGLGLDVGCNVGRYTRILAEEGRLRVCGVDYAESLVRIARTRQPDGLFVRANAYELPFPSDHFEYVMSLGLLQCVMDWKRVLGEIVRVLRPGGMAIVETNRAFSTTEALLRSLSYVMRGKMSWSEHTGFLRSYSVAGKDSVASNTPRKYSPWRLQRFLRDCPLKTVVVHDPCRYWLFHDFIFALSFVKTDAESAGTPPRIEVCRECGHAGIKGRGSFEVKPQGG